MTSSPVRFGLLGPLLLLHAGDGTPLDPGGPRPRALLTLLLLEAGRVLPVESLVRGVYGARPPASAANALQSQVSRLRRRIAPLGARIEHVPAGYRLALDDPGAVDVHRFTTLARRGQDELRTGDVAAAAATLRTALGLWRGPALADLPGPTEHLTRLDDLRRTALRSRVEAELRQGGAHELVPELRGLVTASPLDEPLAALLMRALRDTGRPAEALTVFQETRDALTDALGADPSPALAALHTELLRAAGPEFLAPLSQLPVPLTGLVGREEELAALGGLLDSERLVTLTGPGGAGKTRLAVEAARAGRLPACLVELGPLTDGAQVPYALLTAIGARDGFRTGGGEPAQRLLTALRGRPVLLLVDNCEHLVEDAARWIARVLAACPETRVLATSREALGITGEVVRTVPPLRTAGAARLFRERAAAVRPGPRGAGTGRATDARWPTGDVAHAPGVRGGARAPYGAAREREDRSEADVVADICAVLDGLPLAIELAAARLRTLTPRELAARLDDRFGVLSRGDRTKAPRHRTLRAVVEWSWELLDERERRLARRLAVFVDGAHPEAVAAVCAVPESREVLDSLVEKSFVEVVAGRYRMLETIRAYCADQLAAAGETRRLGEAHAAYFLRLAEDSEAGLRGAGQLPLLDLLDAERMNLDAALRRLLSERPEEALRLMAALTWFWRLRGLYAQQAEPARQLLTALGGRPPSGLVEEYALCLLNALGGDPATPGQQQLIARLDGVLATVEGPFRLPVIAVLWSFASGPAPRLDPVAARQLSGSPWASAVLLLGAGYLHLLAGRPVPAEDSFRRALAGFRAVGERWGMANCLGMLAQFAGWRGAHGRALALLDEALTCTRELRAPEEIADVLAQRAQALVHAGDLSGAEEELQRAEALYRGTTGLSDKVAAARRALGDVARHRGEPALAARRYTAARAALSVSWFGASEEVRILLGLSRTAMTTGDADGAARWLEQARERAGATGGRGEPAEVHEARARYELLGADSGRFGRAAELLGTAEALRGTPSGGDPETARVRETVRARLGDVAYRAAAERGSRSPSATVSER